MYTRTKTLISHVCLQSDLNFYARLISPCNLDNGKPCASPYDYMNKMPLTVNVTDFEVIIVKKKKVIYKIQTFMLLYICGLNEHLFLIYYYRREYIFERKKEREHIHFYNIKIYFLIVSMNNAYSLKDL